MKIQEKEIKYKEAIYAECLDKRMTSFVVKKEENEPEEPTNGRLQSIIPLKLPIPTLLLFPTTDESNVPGPVLILVSS